MLPAMQTLAVLLVVIVLFISEAMPLAITAMGGAIALGMLGIIPLASVFRGLADSTVIIFASMFVIGAATFHTGLAQAVGNNIVRITGKRENALILGIMLIAALLSSITSNTGTTAVLMPVVMGICAAAEIHPARLLMPLAYAAALGGMITLIGTPPNVIAASALKAAGLRPFGFFEFGAIGLPLTVAGICYMILIGKRFLPQKAYRPDKRYAATTPRNTSKRFVSGVILLAVIVLMALNVRGLPLEIVAVGGALLCVLTGCLNERQAYRSIDWVTIFLFAGMLAIAEGLDRSGAARLIADLVVLQLGNNPDPLLVTAALFALAAGLTQFMSNTACAALLAPIGVSIAKKLGISPQAVLMAIAIASSCAFATPVGTPSNLLVLGPARYRFIDYVKVGSGLVVLCFLVALLVIPGAWPFLAAK